MEKRGLPTLVYLTDSKKEYSNKKPAKAGFLFIYDCVKLYQIIYSIKTLSIPFIFFPPL